MIPILSVIMPVYNAEDTVSRALLSVLNTYRRNEIEILVVDDCSSDSTVQIVANLQKEYPKINLLSMPQNSGGPSAPRNLAIEQAKGEYVAFLDDDDTVNVENLLKMVDQAKDENIDLIRGYLYIVNGKEMTIRNRLHEIPKTTEDTIRNMIIHQSTTSDFIVRREVLANYDIRYPTDIRIGEDTVFYFEILANCKRVAYVDYYFLYYAIGMFDISNPSSTQRCDDKEISHQIMAWERSQKILQKIDLDYYKLRLHSSFRNLLISIVRFSTGISEGTYSRLYNFTTITRASVRGKMNLHSRYDELYQAILSGNYKHYLDVAKRRLLIAGYDLKFVLPLIPYLSIDFNVKVDEWTGHNAHDKKQSQNCVKWADIIWCEWLLGNAVYYAEHKNDNQCMVVRCHRFEVERDFGNQVDLSKVDMSFAVSYFYFELFLNSFSIPREKMRLLPNYVEDSIYSTVKSPDAKFNIGLVGSLPRRKGLYRALELLLMLRKKEPRFKLYVMGQQAKYVPWIRNNPSEFEYYENCEKFIDGNDLSDAVVYGGFVERENLYKDIGYVLSLSDDEDIPESFHLAPAEGVCTGSMALILRWRGAEYIYPDTFIFETLEDMATEILRASVDDVYFTEKSTVLRDFVLERYGLDKFLQTLDGYMRQLFLL